MVELPLVFQDKVFVNSASIRTHRPHLAHRGPRGCSVHGVPVVRPCLRPCTVETLDRRQVTSRRPTLRWLRSSLATPCWPTARSIPPSRWKPGRIGCACLNACNARFLNLQLYQADASPNGITLDPNPGARLNANLPYTWQGAEPVVRW